MKPKAILSVSNKEGIVNLAQVLVNEFNYELISSGGTASHLEKAGIPVSKVSSVTSFPEILGGRVKTLHPLIHGGILADRDIIEHQKDVEANNIDLIELVVVNLYPFQEVILQENCSFEFGIENIDIGGPTLIRAAAKNNKHVTVLTNPNQYESYIKLIMENNLSLSARKNFALEALPTRQGTISQ